MDEIKKPFADYSAEFLQTLENKGKSLNTIKNYKTDLDCFELFLRNNKMDLYFLSVSPELLLKYGDFLENKYKSDNSKRRKLQTLRLFFDFLVERNLVTSNIIKSIPTSPKFLDIPRPTPFIDVKTLWVHLLLEQQQQKNKIEQLICQRNQIIALLIFGAGLKVSDLATLSRKHIYTDKTPRVLIANTKKEPYSIPLPNIFTTVFNSYIKLLEVEKQKSKMEFDKLLFNANPYQILSGGLSPRGLEIVFKELKEKLDIILTPKSLRQACIFKWLHQRKHTSQIKEWLGVAPSYSLKTYQAYQKDHIYNDEFLEELYKHYCQ